MAPQVIERCVTASAHPLYDRWLNLPFQERGAGSADRVSVTTAAGKCPGRELRRARLVFASGKPVVP